MRELNKIILCFLLGPMNEYRDSHITKFTPVPPLERAITLKPLKILIPKIKQFS